MAAALPAQQRGFALLGLGFRRRRRVWGGGGRRWHHSHGPATAAAGTAARLWLQVLSRAQETLQPCSVTSCGCTSPWPSALWWVRCACGGAEPSTAAAAAGRGSSRVEHLGCHSGSRKVAAQQQMQPPPGGWACGACGRCHVVSSGRVTGVPAAGQRGGAPFSNARALARALTSTSHCRGAGPLRGHLELVQHFQAPACRPSGPPDRLPAAAAGSHGHGRCWHDCGGAHTPGAAAGAAASACTVTGEREVSSRRSGDVRVH